MRRTRASRAISRRSSARVAALDSLEGVQRTLPQGATFLHPTAVLFNGGVFKSTLLTQRVLDTLNSWLAAEGAPPARLLEGADLDLAVARGAAYYGYVKRGRGVRIRGGTARAYYVAIESAMPAVPAEPPVQALCVAPFGMEEGSDAALPPQEFGLVVGEPVQFRFFGSSVRRRRHAARLLVAGRAAGAGGNPGDAARRRAHRRRGRAREAACARDRSRHARTRGDPERYGRALEGRVRRARRRLSAMKRYTVGIDLGTSNTVVAYVEAGSDAIRVFDVEQLVGPGAVAAQPLLPSVRYHPAAGELPPDTLRLPWAAHAKASAAGATPAVIGRYARTLGAQVPGRLVTSAKSWLSHASVDRLAAILPWGAADGVDKVSPVDASASYLAHVRDAWDARFPDAPLAKQDVILTVPASFDDGARALTVEAARRAKLPALRLLEEPQAAFYDWLYGQRDTLRETFAAARRVLICDVGGGTTDLTLVDVAPGGDGEPTFTRVGVGNHLMLGGDNMDLALARLVESRLTSRHAAVRREPVAARRALPCREGAAARRRCARIRQRHAARRGQQARRRRALGRADATGSRADRRRRVLSAGRSRRVAARARRDRRIRAALCERRGRHAARRRVPESSCGRPAARHAAAQRRRVPRGALAGRLAQTLGAWRGAPLDVLHNAHPDVAVARARWLRARRACAAHRRRFRAQLFPRARRWRRRRARGVCLLPRGTEEGHEIRLDDRTFALQLGQPVRFHLVSTVADTAYRPGDLVDLDAGDFVRLPPIATVVDAKWAAMRAKHR